MEVSKLIKHPYLQWHNDIDEIIAPLKKLGIYYFTYLANYSDGSQINLSNIPDWLEHYYKYKLYTSSSFELHPKGYQHGFKLWPIGSPLPVLNHAREYFNSDHGVTFIIPGTNKCEFFFFSTHKNNSQIVELYINSNEILKKFCLYFKDKANSLLKKAEQCKIILPIYQTQARNQILLQNSTGINYHFNEKLIKEVIRDIAVERLQVIGSYGQNVNLTKREIQCAVYFLHGLSAKESARHLGITDRTVESYLKAIRKKLHCGNKAEFIKVLLENGITYI